ncbi:MAG: SMC-Scp complex subunit ScpB [Candidatus Omnitrophota bacterium]
MDQSSLEHVKGVIEALLFVNEKPVMLSQIKDVLEGVDIREIKETVEQLKQEYSDRKRGMAIVEIADGYQMLSNSIYAAYLRSFYKTKHKEKLSKPALETVAIVAYKEPVTRGEIELIRGVNSDGVVAHLLGKELIKVVGRKDIPGRPFLYGTTKQFLEYFGLKSLSDLPRLEDFPKLERAAEQERTEEVTPSGEPSPEPHVPEGENSFDSGLIERLNEQPPTESSEILRDVGGEEKLPESTDAEKELALSEVSEPSGRLDARDETKNNADEGGISSDVAEKRVHDETQESSQRN